MEQLVQKCYSLSLVICLKLKVFRHHPFAEGFELNVRELRWSAGAGFVVVMTGEIIAAPGLPKVPAAEFIDVNENGDTVGLF